MTMATKIAVLNLGKLQQLGTPQEVYEQPVNMFVAGFIGSPATNFFNTVIRREGESITADFGTVQLPVPPQVRQALAPYIDKRIIVGIRPEHIHDAEFTPASTDVAILPATVDVTEMLGNETLLHLVSGEHRFLARVDPRTQARPGREMKVAVDVSSMMFFDPETEMAVR